MKTVPEGTLARTSVAGLATVKYGARRIQSLAKRPFLSGPGQQQEKQRLEDETADILFRAFSQLRGTALKIAQMLSMETQLLPPALQRELAKSYHQVPPLNRALVRKTMIKELGLPPEDIFASFEPQAFAAASLGQVHDARSRDGDVLAVKVQYPGIGVTIENDVRLLRRLLRTLPRSEVLLTALDEIHHRLREEVDYLHEARCSEWFRARVVEKSIVIPQVFPEVSSVRILTTQRLDGMHLAEWLETNPSQEKRDLAAQLIYDFFVHSVYHLHRLHADPNPGNFLFRSDGSIGVIDFGCSRTLSPGFSSSLLKLFVGYFRGERSEVFAAYSVLGMFNEDCKKENDALYDDLLQPFGEWLCQPLREEVYDFRQHHGYTSKGFGLARRMLSHPRCNNINQEFCFVDRTYFGLFQMFEKMAAQVRLRHPLFEASMLNER